MRNLIYVNMMRLKKNRIFRAGVAVSMAYVAFLLFMNYQEAADSPETVIRQLNWYFLSTLPVASAFCSVFCGMFLGTEYSDGTMRNKLMVGHTRKEIYIANHAYRFSGKCLCLPFRLLCHSRHGDCDVWLEPGKPHAACFPYIQRNPDAWGVCRGIYPAVHADR